MSIFKTQTGHVRWFTGF